VSSAALSDVEIVACETCGGNQRDAHGRTRGEGLIAELHSEREKSAAQVTISTSRCLWACQRSCAVHLRSPSRVGYVLVELAPDQASAEAVLAYAALYAQSEDGAVPYKQWPPLLRGHFLCRIPKTASPALAQPEPDRKKETP
jgi:predicted metal-binding protein